MQGQLKSSTTHSGGDGDENSDEEEIIYPVLENELMTETLAKIYLKQKKYKKA